MIRFVSTKTAEVIHSGLIRRSGGADGLRDRGLLESAVARARNKSLYDETASLAEIGASLAYGLVKNHAFVDGNKRIGLALLVVFFRINGRKLTCTPEEETAKIKQVAGSEITEDEWIAWVVVNSGPLQSSDDKD